MTALDRNAVASYIISPLALIAVFYLGILPAFLAGLLVYHIVEFGARGLKRSGVIPSTGRIILLALVAGVIISGLFLLVEGISSQVASGPEGIGLLFRKMADVLGRAGSYLPPEAAVYLPASIDEWQKAASGWMLSNASDFSKAGIGLGRFMVHVIIGMIIGGMIALRPHPANRQTGLARALQERLAFLARAFRRIVFSQIKISALNTSLTAVFILGILPLAGIDLPLQKTMVAVTFIAGLLPVIGNLISNTAIFLVGLSVSPFAAVIALGYLMLIHKLEYFMNARIIGGQIHARAWEILIAMLVLESAFGIAGLVAAPIYYACLKDELSARKLI